MPTYKTITNDDGLIMGMVEVPPHPVEALIASGAIRPVPVPPTLTTDDVHSSWGTPMDDNRPTLRFFVTTWHTENHIEGYSNDAVADGTRVDIVTNLPEFRHGLADWVATVEGTSGPDPFGIPTNRPLSSVERFQCDWEAAITKYTLRRFAPIILSNVEADE